KSSFIENNQNSDTSANRHVCNVENSIKETEIFPSHKRNPIRKISFPNRKINHIYDIAMKQGSVGVFREKCCYLTIRMVKNDTIKYRINNITYSTRKNKCNGSN